MAGIYDGGPAFPSTMPYAPAAAVGPQSSYYGTALPYTWTAPTTPTISSPGMSLRDWIAGTVAPSILAELYAQLLRNEQCVDSCFRVAAGASYEFADAMLAARSKSGAE